MSSNELGYPHTEVGRQAGAECVGWPDAPADSPAKYVPHTGQCASHICHKSGRVRPSVLVMTHSLDQNVVARKAKARKCTAKIAGNVQAKVERLMTLFLSSHQPGAIPKGTPKCV